MLEAIIAGILIAAGGAMYLAIGGIVGAIMFSLGLLTILSFKFHLFTGKAGLLTTRDISPTRLGLIWCGNLIGTAIGAILCLLVSWSDKHGFMQGATNIMNTRISNMWFENIILGIFCGLLMYIAVTVYETKPWVTVMCVSAFILSGFNHCVADMFYFFMASPHINIGLAAITIICTTIGNIIGCNIIPLCEKMRRR
jgi:formate/nitrite transporter FocA (FNT family)